MKALKNKKQLLLNKIRYKKATSSEIRYEIELYAKYIRSHELATIENYPRKKIINAICNKYPDRICSLDLEETTILKTTNIMRKLYDTIFEQKEKICINPLVLRMLMKCLNNNKDDNIIANGNVFVIKNYLEVDSTGRSITPEPKILKHEEL